MNEIREHARKPKKQKKKTKKKKQRKIKRSYHSFNDGDSSSDYIASNDTIVSEQQMGCMRKETAVA
jgi:glutamate dehydrogenase/leucine dehydrogenase